MKKILFAALVAMITLSASAQQVTTLYFLENAPMRHTINPAFQPVSRGFINFSPLGWMSYGIGDNSLTIQDIFFVDPVTGKTITPLHPNADKAKFLRQIRSMTLMNGETTLGLLNMGFRIKENGFLTIGINERASVGATLPKSIFDFVFDGGMKDLTGGINTIDLGGISAGGSVYTEIGAGYSHKINEKWTVGGKLKFLLGTAYAGLDSRDLKIDANTEAWDINGTMRLDVAAPVNLAYLSQYINGKNINQIVDGFKDGSFNQDSLINRSDVPALVKGLVRPSGYGAALDFGITYKPIENLQISAAITDLGFIYWSHANRFTCTVDTTFEGAGHIDYNDPAYRDADGNFSTEILMDTVQSRLMGLLNGVKMGDNGGRGFARMTSARLNIGLDANFWDNRVGVGIVSATRLYNARLYEEVTIGAAFRPVNWFNIALSYSLLNNGKYSNIGAGLSFMPYDGINLTLALDYIPTSYAGMNDGKGGKRYVIPDKAKMVNVALGFSICWGSNRRDKDKDGVWDKLDQCPETPRGVAVDSVGCPLDEDHDGVPDYLDHCPGTPAAAIHFIDENGCALDTDGDGVEDYIDECPNTPEAAYGKIDEKGCPLDSDGDGVPDYLDDCPNTPEAAYGKIDEKGCPLDSDGDGVMDYEDECPNTPEAAYGKIDEKGCPLDTDGDGVPDYLDECPNTKKEAIGHVDAKGCDLDSDGDGVMDYEDECPNVPGIRANKGCPEIKREVRKLLEKAMQGIEFETGKSTIKPKSYPLMDQIAQTFLDNPNYIIEVQGHTDNVGKPESNLKLSQDRADAVRNYLINKGVEAERMTAIGYGQDQPIEPNTTKQGRQKNRRVQFKITFEEVHYETILDHADPTPAE
jgi:outer membrane protein OmpA-like peptidoglycan-associated protein